MFKLKIKNYFNKTVFIFIFITIISFILFYLWNTKSDIEINVIDTNSPISTEIDNFMENNKNNPGVHMLKSGGYKYVFIVSDKEKANEISINLYKVYKHKFKINIEYQVEINEYTISESNPEKIQTMLIRFKELGKINPIEIIE